MRIAIMRFVAAVSWMVLLACCAPVRDAPPPPATRVVADVKPAPGDEAPAEPVRLMKTEVSGIMLEGVAFDSRNQRLVVADQKRGPGSSFTDAAAAGGMLGGWAAVNAGFFTPEGEPLGLVVSAGKPAGAWNSASSLGSGVWHEDSSGQSSINRRERLGRVGAIAMRELIQAGPLLVENNRAVSGLDPVKTSVRTFILWDGGSRWCIGRASACSLAELSKAIITASPAGWPVKHALNLDGGRSSDLWVSEKIPGGPLVRRAPWNRPVRNFLVLTPILNP